jgi:hypothetical protein
VVRVGFEISDIVCVALPQYAGRLFVASAQVANEVKNSFEVQ